MIKEASKIVDLAVEFCRNNLDNLMVYGSLIAIFIIIFSIVRVSRKGDDEDLDFDEVAYKKEKEDQGKQDVSVVDSKSEFVGVCLPPLTARILAYEDSVDEFEVPEADLVDEFEVPKADSEVKTEAPAVGPQRVVSKNTSCIEDIIEGLANLSADGVKKVEIKIQGAEVKITYGNDEVLNVVEDTQVCDSKPVAETKPCDKGEELGEVPDQKKIIEAKIYKKFGPDNNNVTRSGRVYSEEELEKQIRD